jgi:hypothetical protein
MEPNTLQKQLNEETLDPGDWSEFRQFAHKVLDDVCALRPAQSGCKCQAQHREVHSGNQMRHALHN